MPTEPAPTTIDWVAHRDSERWAAAAAAEIAAIAHGALQAGNPARLLLSGGNSPRPVYERLARAELDWTRVTFALVDERWLPPGAADSNARLLQDSLGPILTRARFEPLVQADLDRAACVQAANVRAAQAPPPCLAVLGMGEDGHTASLFPGARNLARAVASPLAYAAVDAEGCPGAGAWPLRISATPAGLGRARQRLLLIRGMRKRTVLEAALAGGDPARWPIRHILDLPGPPLRVHWCP